MPRDRGRQSSQLPTERTKKWAWLTVAADDVADEMWMAQCLPRRAGRRLATGLVVLAILLFGLVAGLTLST